MQLPTWNAPTSLTPEAIERRRRLAEALMTQGMDASPVQHWTQGAARLAQALAGSYQMSRADKADAQLRAEAEQKAAAEKAAAEQKAREAQMAPDIAYNEGIGLYDKNWRNWEDPRTPLILQQAQKKQRQWQKLNDGTLYRDGENGPEFAPVPGGQGGQGLSASAYTKGAPQGMKWVDPSNVDAGLEPVAGYEAKIPSEVAGKVAMMDVARKGIEETRQEFEKDWGLQGSAQSAASELPGWMGGDAPMLSGPIGRAKRNVRMGVEAALRVMTGAAAPESEVQRYADMFTPGVMDDAASTKQKLDALMAFMNKADQVIKQGRGGAVEPDGKQPKAASSGGYQTFEDLAPNLSEGTVFEDTETGKSYRVQDGEIVEIQ